MTDIATVGLAVDSRQVRKADKDLNRLSKTGKKVEKSTDQMKAGFKRLAGALIGVAAATAGVRKLVTISRSFDVMNASLVTVTGSVEGANQAFDALQAFAKETPFSLDEVTTAFVKMGVLGLDPSREALISYGNTASAMGKSLNQLIEAVADAATGEFERLKEFGIKAKQQGDQVSLTFKGITTKIGNNSEEIQKYLKEIGDNDFAGAMERRANSLDGALSNLEVSWDQLFLTISQQGTGALIEQSVRDATAAIEELDVFIASGALSDHINALSVQFDQVGNDITATMNALNKVINSAGIDWGESGESASDFIAKAFLELPTNIRTTVQIITIELAVLIDKAAAIGKEIQFALLSPIEAASRFLDTGETGIDRISAELDRINGVRLNSIELILKEAEETKKAASEHRKAAVISLEVERVRRAARTGELPSLGGGGDGKKGPTQAEIKAREKRAAALAKSEKALKNWLEKAELELSLSGQSAEQREKSIKLWELEKQGIDLTSSAYADLADRLDEVFDQREAQRKFIEEQEKTAEKQQKIWEDTVGQIQGHFSDNFFDIMQGNFDSLGDGFKAMLDRMIADALSAQLTQSLFGSQGSPTGLGSLLTGGGGIFGGLFGGGGSSASPLSSVLSFEDVFAGNFANGGSFTVGGQGGIDNNRIGLNVSRGERVTVETPQQQRSGGITNNITFMVQGALDKRSQQQAAGAVFEATARAAGRNR